MTSLTAEEALEKYQRRHRRNMRASHAQGFLLGVASMLQKGDLVIDCGANIGEVTQPLAETGASIHCFEPDPYAFEQLSSRVMKLDNVILHNAAVGTESGTVQLMRAVNFGENPKGGSVKSTVLKGGRSIDESNPIDVELIDLIAFIKHAIECSGEIAFLKMDIEGAELDILERMEAENLFDSIRCTVVETHERKFKALRPRFKALKERVGNAYPVSKVNLDWI
ncbi:FkbM family methyltransferase [Pseudopelagicola sp. nBUS_19]|uniref:FkbM family methyltransferase n=1 Tax=unclassified Pseudopelagicola TaxID=2649563 RepID=UPI003EBBDAA5